MLSPLPFLDDIVNFDYGLEGELAETHCSLPVSGNFKEETCKDSMVKSLDADDVKVYLDLVENQKNYDGPPSPYFGRTTPSFYGNNYGPDVTGYACAPETYQDRAHPDIQTTSALLIQIPLLHEQMQFPESPPLVPDFSQLAQDLLNSPIAKPECTENKTASCVETNKYQSSDPDKKKVEPKVINRLRNKIQKRRRDSGLQDATVEWKEPQPEELTARDLERRERRRASNRKAAAKSRVKKRAQSNVVEEEMSRMETDNVNLRGEVTTLRKELYTLTSAIRHHVTKCGSPDTLTEILKNFPV